MPTQASFDHNIAIMRAMPASFLDALTQHPPPEPIDLQQAQREHEAYQELVAGLVSRAIHVPADNSCPDCCFIEDAAVVLGSGATSDGRAIAVLTRPGAPTRQPEVPAVRQALLQLGFTPSDPPSAGSDATPGSVTGDGPQQQHRLYELTPPATLDGGDVLFVGSSLWVGLSKRTNQAAVDQMRSILQGVCPVYGLPLPEGGALHLKSLVTAITEDVLLVADNPQGHELMRLVEATPGALQGHTCLYLPDMLAANVLRIGPHVVFQAGHPRSEPLVAQLCQERGLQLHCISMAEFAKADGALTCCSLLFSL